MTEGRPHQAGWLIGGVVALGTLLWCLVAWRTFSAAPIWFDDSFISFRYARALVDGHGFVFNVEDGPVEGFTNLGWVLALAGLHGLGAPLDTSARVLGLGCFAFTLGLHGWAAGRQAASPWAALVAAAALGTLVLPFGLVALAGTGLETPAATLCAVGLAVWLWRPPSGRWGGVVATGLALASLLIRLDGGVFVAAFGLTLTWKQVATRRVGEARWRKVTSSALLLVPTALGLAAVLLWKWRTFGALFPNTYYAKSADVPQWAAGGAYWWAFLQNSPQVLVLAALSLVGAWRGPGRWAARYALLGTALFTLYGAKVGGDFMYFRFAFEVYPLLTFGAVLGLVALADATRAQWMSRALAVACVAAALFLSTGPPHPGDPYGSQSMEAMNRFVLDGRAVGRRLREALPQDTRIATTLAGTIPFDSGLFTVDQWGLTDPFVAHLPSAPLTLSSRGHVKPAPVSYLRARGVNLVLGHPALCDCTALCDDDVPAVYLRVEQRCLRLWYLERTPELTKLFCSSADFIPRHVDCSGEELPSFSWGEGTSRSLTEGEFRKLTRGASARWPLDAVGPDVAMRGVAFGAGPTRTALPRQQAVSGMRGGFLDSFHGGDEPTGLVRLTLPPTVRRVALRIAGGDDCDTTFVGLARGGHVLARACGKRTEMLAPVLLEAPVGEGELEVVAVDAASGAWGHLLVDEVVALPDEPLPLTPAPLPLRGRGI